MNALAPRTLRTPADLLAAGLAEDAAMADLTLVAGRYATAIPPAVAQLIQTAGAPIARQFVPSAEELHIAPEERSDPIGDHSHAPVKGIVHRYPDRVLLMPTLTCAVYCRFCFRRETVGGSGALTAAEMDAALSYIRDTPQIWEVILTGGDPLVLSPRRLDEIVAALDEIPHVKILRVHTRVPIAAPERIDDALIAALKRSGKTVYMAIHCNHADELTAGVVAACAKLADAGIPLLSQSVLLKDINDTTEALEALFRALVAARIKPYYLHQLDLAPGTSHFRVPLDRGQALVNSLRGRLSGLAQPTYILDIPGGAGKVPAGAAHISPEGDGTYIVRDPAGAPHPYPPRTA
jgi:lysine 2,3-aminomutase